MNIVVNFIPLKKGGGVQVGLDFLNQVKLYGKEHNWFVVATEGTPFVNYKYSENVSLVKLISRNLVDRLKFEYVGCKDVINKTNAHVIYTQFGPIWPGATVTNIAGCAYSNLMYPEIDFWGKLPLLSQIKKRVIDFFRIKRMLAADQIIFETQDLLERAIKIYNLPESRVHFVSPAISSLVKVSGDANKKISSIPEGFRILLLSHYRVHKNIEILPKVSEILNTRFNIKNVVFVLTLNDDKKSQNIYSKAIELGVNNYICNIGSIDYEECGSLYEACDAVILPSLLESFSNTIAEAWLMKKPLIISDFEWSRSLCGDAAIYIKYNDEEDTAYKIARLITNKKEIETVVRNGMVMLNKYSTAKSRFLSYKKIIENVVNQTVLMPEKF